MLHCELKGGSDFRPSFILFKIVNNARVLFELFSKCFGGHMKTPVLLKDTSMVSKIAIEHTVLLCAHGINRNTAMDVVNTQYKYSKGTMESYFGKLGAQAKKGRNEAKLAQTPSFL